MSSPLTRAHIAGERELRRMVARATRLIWGGLPAYDRENVGQFTSAIVPIVLAAQRQSVALTEGYLARALERPPIGVAPELLIGSAVRAGTPPEDVYARPFVTVWTALQAGTAYEDAVGAGLARAVEAATMDVQLSARETFTAVEAADDGIYGYQRVADGNACMFCQLVDGAYVKSGDAMALHNGCGCSLEPLTAPHRLASQLPSGVAVRDHGELGPMLGSPAHDFTQL